MIKYQQEKFYNKLIKVYEDSIKETKNKCENFKFLVGGKLWSCIDGLGINKDCRITK